MCIRDSVMMAQPAPLPAPAAVVQPMQQQVLAQSTTDWGNWIDQQQAARGSWNDQSAGCGCVGCSNDAGGWQVPPVEMDDQAVWFGGVPMQEIPIWYQDHVSGDWWSQDTGVVQVSQEEEHAYEADCNGPPPSSEEQANDCLLYTSDAADE